MMTEAQTEAFANGVFKHALAKVRRFSPSEMGHEEANAMCAAAAMIAGTALAAYSEEALADFIQDVVDTRNRIARAGQDAGFVAPAWSVGIRTGVSASGGARP